MISKNNKVKLIEERIIRTRPMETCIFSKNISKVLMY